MQMTKVNMEPGSRERKPRPESQDFEAYLREIKKRLPEWILVPMDPPKVGLEAPSSRLVDFGDRVVGDTGSDHEIEAMLELARLKGWTTLRFEGPEDFVKRASERALKAEFGLSDMEVTSSVPDPEPRLPEIPGNGTAIPEREDLEDDHELKCD
jgi:hypothetical protein